MMDQSVPSLMLEQLEAQACERGLLLRLQVGRPLRQWSLRVVVARPIDASRVQLLGEMKGWAYNASNGLQLDTMRVIPSRSVGVGDLIWAATMAWAMENTPCRQARLLAIRDDERQHRRLRRYFEQRGFSTVRDVEVAVWDLPLRMIWGGAGALMTGTVETVLQRSIRGWNQSAA